jgi:hypothetical protein
MSKPGRQSKSGAPSRPPTKPQRHAPAQVGPSARTVARVWRYTKVGLALALITYVLVMLAQTGTVSDLLTRAGWSAPSSTIEPQ